MNLATTSLAQVRQLYEQGLYLQALEAGKALGPIHQWQGVEARLLGGRLATNLGAMRLGRVLHRLAWREAPEDSEVRFFYVLALLDRRGVLEAWESSRRLGEAAGDIADRRAEWWALQAYIFGLLRDFERADEAIRRALELTPKRAWIWVQHCAVLQMEDRHDESLEAAMKAMELEPWYRPAVQAAAHTLVQFNRTDDALAMLTEASTKIESGDVLAQLASLQTELELYEESRANWDRVEEFYPLVHFDKRRQQWLYARRSDAAYYCGDYDAAAELAEKSEMPFHTAVAERMQKTPREPKRVMLPVGFVRQHHLTCAPATLTAISNFWDRPADHLETAEKICYDGTPAHSERKWAEESGFVTREFRVTWDSAVALIDAGIPFTLTTVDPGNAHLQAVIGYDRLRGTLLVRDPTERMFGEFRGEEMIQHYQSTGPRGMLIAAPERAAAVEAIDLPEAELYDQYYQLELALLRHNREAAESIHDEMSAAAPDHRLVLYGGRALAGYDANPIMALEYIDRLLAQFPEDVNLILAKLGCLHELGRRDERLALLKQMHEQKDSDTLFTIWYARELSEDPRENETVEYLARRAIRYRPVDGASFELLANICWAEMRRKEATELYRIAACLNDKDENLAKSYFSAARHMKQTDAVLEFLKDRVRRSQRQSSSPARTLCWAYEQLEQADDALAALERAIETRPDDGDLLIAASRTYTSYGRRERATELLEAARDKTSRTAWLRAAATLASLGSDSHASLDYWREVLEREPLAPDANEIVPQLIASVDGEQAAIEHVCRQVERFPHNYAIRSVRIDWAARQDAEIAEEAVSQMLETYPNDPRARCELAVALCRQARWDEALVEAKRAEQLDPISPVAPVIVGRIHEAQGRLAEAQEEFRRAIRLSVDCDAAMESLMGVCDTKQERIEALQFIESELVRQVSFGDGLMYFRYFAAATLDPDALLKTLREAHAARPELWQSWAVLVQHLVDLERNDEALHVAQQAVERFPLLPRLWLELASVQRNRKDAAAEIRAIEKALEISPGWGDAERLLAAAYRRQNQCGLAAKALQRAVRADPLECRNFSALAEVLWDEGQHDKAIRMMKHAVELEPGHDVAWRYLQQWADETKQPDLAVDAARALTKSRPKEARSWLVLADALDGPEQQAEKLAALDKVIELNPRNDEAHGRKSMLLAEQGRFDEALAACAPPVYGGDPPLSLRARAAQVVAMRGDLPTAIEHMRGVVADDPDYTWAWSMLAEWHDHLGQNEEYLQACENLVRTSPFEPASFGYRGDARLKLDRRELAKQDFRHAVDIAPDYFYAVRSLLELHLEDEETDAAAELHAQALDHMPPGYAEAYAVRLAVARGDQVAAVGHFGKLLAAPLEDIDPLPTALRDANKLDLGKEIATAIEKRLKRPHALPELGYFWSQTALQTGDAIEVAGRLAHLSDRGDVWANAAAGFLDEVVQAGNGPLAAKFIQENSDRLRSDDRSWAAAGRALSDTNQTRECIEWMSDWQSRQQVTALTLFSLALSLRVERRDQEAAAVNEHALSLPPDNSTPLHQLWLAADAVVGGQVAAAAHLLDPRRDQPMSDYYAALRAMLFAALAVELNERPTSADYRAAVAEVQAASEAYQKDPPLRRLYYACRARLAARMGYRIRAWYWRLWA